MSDRMSFVAKLTIRPGQLEAFKVLIGEMVEVVQAKEPGALGYEYFVSADGTTVHICERYADSAAVMTHMANFAAFGERWDAAVAKMDVVAYGTPSDEVGVLLGSVGGTLMTPLAGFVR